MEKQGVPMNQYPQSPDVTGQQPPVYNQDPNAQQHQHPAQYQQQPGQMYAQPQQPQQAYAGSPPPAQQQQAYPQPGQPGAHPGMPPQAQSGTQYQSATPIASLNRGPAPADCPACGQRSMTNTAFETGNTTHAWAFGLCCLVCLGCIPYIMNSTKDVQHKCGKCGVLLATWHRSGTTEVHIHS
ncbi:hypothetical protein DM02DRAFT_620229 [Periconia macrospinosa]|uniref:LITAF domain-containing protein n=1 Tax=Periconia macrospinosa TaxID=97972 RepID=A0A2V1D3W9_9PLEO|nr:hypothetical protein DM02DRAFT_620229 [Periconia macrospinosa]